MLIMPRIHRRPIERLKSNRSLSVHRTERSKPVGREEKPPVQDRRLVKERRKRQEPVANERRRGDRRLAHLRTKPEVKAMLDNSGAGEGHREGRFVNETV
ncbi:MAG: hypothetical protein MI976_25185 [Pseudomonadales bacterium]|nr:hypothetical protein [Pseudomonadales bacterium]